MIDCWGLSYQTFTLRLNFLFHQQIVRAPKGAILFDKGIGPAGTADTNRSNLSGHHASKLSVYMFIYSTNISHR
jgi:hypothetical protein